MPVFRKVKRYQQENGNVPFSEWLNKLDRSLRIKIESKTIKLENGNDSDCSILKGTGGIKEARIKTASGLRIYFAEDAQNIILLLIGGDKDTQKKDIAKAIEYFNDYKQRRSQ